MMNTANILELVKARLGISSTARDTYLQAIIESIIAELSGEKGIKLAENNMNHVLFICDYAAWRYQSKGESGGLPRHLQYRLHNLIIHDGGDG